MKNKLLTLAICALLPSLGCESKPTDSSSETPESSGPATPGESQSKRGPMQITAVKAVASQATLQTEGSPVPKEVEAWMKESLYATDDFSADAKRFAAVKFTYDIRNIPAKDGKPVIDVVIFGQVKEPKPQGSETPNVFKYDVRMTDKQFPKATLSELVKKSVERFATAVSGQARVSGATPEELMEIIKNDKNPEARLMAVRQVREARILKAVPAIRPLLEDKDADLRVTAAAALVANGDGESYSKIVKIAEDFSRERDPHMMAIVFLIGEMQTGESRTYLQTLAESHPAEPIREAAKKALTKSGAMP